MPMELRSLSLCLLVLSNVVLVFSISLSRLKLRELDVDEDKSGIGAASSLEQKDLNELSSALYSHRTSKLYLTSTAVAASEAMKLMLSFFLEMYTRQQGFVETWETVKEEILEVDMLRIGLPGILYVIENNLLFIALSNLPVTVFEVTDQLKIFTTALFSVVVLDLKLSKLQRLSLLFLAFGVATVELADSETMEAQEDQNPTLGLIALLCCVTISGFAGAYFEKIVKHHAPGAHDEGVSIFVRNVQLAVYGLAFGILAVFFSAEADVEEGGFFQNYTFMTWLVISAQALGGVTNALVIKHANNVLKGFAASVATIIASSISMILIGMKPTGMFMLGCLTVFLSIVMYGRTGIPAITRVGPTFLASPKKNSEML